MAVPKRQVSFFIESDLWKLFSKKCIDVDSELVADLQEIAHRKGHTMPQLRRRAYAQYVNTDRSERGQKPKHYKIAK